MAIPQVELQNIFNIAAPASYWQGGKGTVVLMYESRHKRAVAQRGLASRGIQSVETQLARHHVPEGQYGLQIVWVQVSYQVGKVHSDLPTRPSAPGDTLIQAIRAEVKHERVKIPQGYFRVIPDELGLGKTRVQSHSFTGSSVVCFDADEEELRKNYVKMLWKSGLVNLDGIYFRPKEPDELGEYHFSLSGGLRHGEEYDIPWPQLEAEERQLRSEGYVRMTRHKGGSGEDSVETYLIADKMQTVGRQ